MKEFSNRYVRQIVLPNFGMASQRKLLKSSVLIVGMGGLGCPASLYLAGAGVGKIGIADPEKVEESNLHRQVLFDTNCCGKSKVKEALKRLRALNPDILVEDYCTSVTKENVLSLIEEYDVVIDGTDNFSTKYLLNDATFKAGKPLVLGSVFAYEGYISVFNYSSGPCYRCLFPTPPTSYIPNCEEMGVIGAVTGIVGSIQAFEAIKVILNSPPFLPLAGKYLQINTLTMGWHEYKVEKDPKCLLCSKKREEVELTEFRAPSCLATSEVREITTEELFKDINKYVLIDVREKEEWQERHLLGALNVPLSQIEGGSFNSIPKERPIVLYCSLGIRSKKAGNILIEKDYREVYSLKGGLSAVMQNGYKDLVR